MYIERFTSKLLGSLKQSLDVHLYDWCFMVPVCMMLGISAYFSFVSEPHFSTGLILMVVFGFLSYLRQGIFLLLFFVCLGFFSAQLRTERLDTRVLHRPTYITKVATTVLEINKKERYLQLLLDGISGLDKVRVAVRTKYDHNIEVGDTVQVSLKLIPPSNATVIYGYDFAQFAYFNKISAVGYATSPVVLLEKGGSWVFANYMNWFRNKIDDFFREEMSAPESFIASALIVGKKDVPQKVLDNIRSSGLAHLLAISGLHLSLIASLFFGLNRWLLSRSTYLALRFDIKKIAASASIIMITVYLMLSGMSISAQRAYIMVLMVFTAILFDRETLAAHSLVVAAVFILLFEPEAVMQPSFQMSFAAVMALVRFGSVFHANYLLSILLSSVVATIATLPYSVYHFNYYALGGLIANVLAIPIATFVIIPCGLIAALSYSKFSVPFLFVMEHSITILVKIAEYFASWETFIIHVHSFSGFALLMMSIGIVWLCMWPNKLQWAGGVLIIFGVSIAYNYSTPDVLLDINNVAVKGANDKLYFLNSKQRRNFVSKSWLLDNAQTELLTYQDHNNKKNVSINTDDGVNFLYCKQNKLVTIRYIKGNVSASYNGFLIEPWMLNNYGTITIWVTQNLPWLNAAGYKRPWKHG